MEEDKKQAEIERVARKIVSDLAMDPDAMVTDMVSYRFTTPSCVVYSMPPHSWPLWTFYRRVAESAIDALQASKSES